MHLLLIIFLFFITGFASAEVLYNSVQQKSSHNSYSRDEGILDQLVFHRIRSIEFDLFKSKYGNPTITDDWYVYHFPIFDTRSNCVRFSDCLNQLKIYDELHPNHEIVTIWFDIKDGFSNNQSPQAFDNLIKRYINEQDILKPSDLFHACPGASRLKDTVRGACHWPSLSTLKGKWILVLTDSSYSNNRPERLGFSAAGVSNTRDVDSSNRIFFNTDSNSQSLTQYIFQEGFVSRRYVLNDANGFNAALNGQTHHIATNKVNIFQDSWSKTHNNQGWPFRCVNRACEQNESSENIIGITVNSEDIWGNNDHFIFLQKNKETHNGRWTTAIHVTSSHVDEWAKACMMARASLSMNSPYFAVCRPSDKHKIRIQWRDDFGSNSGALDTHITHVSGIAQADLSFIKMDVYNQGKCAAGFASPNGKQWTKIGSRCFSETLKHQGIGASSHGSRSVKHLFSNLLYWDSRQNSNSFSQHRIGTVRSAQVFDGSF
ncbi:MAG: Ca2+-dependent phosphoinositide-specific phospholipase C [Pseudomonadota bacterium]